MNDVTNPDQLTAVAATPAAMGKQALVCPHRWLVFVPCLAAALGIGMVELGLLWLPRESAAGSELAPAQVWTLQSLITGNIAIFMLTAWGNSFCRLHWPNDISSRSSLGLAAAWSCVGWSTWMVVRATALIGDDIVAPVLVFSFVTLALTIPSLWHAILKLRQPSRSVWVVVGFLGFAIGLQCWATASVGGDPAYIFIINSALVAGAVAVWLAVLSLPPPRTATFQPA